MSSGRRAGKKKKRKQCLYKPGFVYRNVLRLSLSFIYSAGHPTALASYPPSHRSSGGLPSNDGIRGLAAPRWHSPVIAHRLVVSCTTFSPLPHARRGGCFLLPTLTVAGNFHFQKWGALCCPDFPLAHLVCASDRTEALFPGAKLQIYCECGTFIPNLCRPTPFPEPKTAYLFARLLGYSPVGAT